MNTTKSHEDQFRYSEVNVGIYTDSKMSAQAYKLRSREELFTKRQQLEMTLIKTYCLLGRKSKLFTNNTHLKGDNQTNLDFTD
jgi:glutathionyl-hydroquinone reductase